MAFLAWLWSATRRPSDAHVRRRPPPMGRRRSPGRSPARSPITSGGGARAVAASARAASCARSFAGRILWQSFARASTCRCGCSTAWCSPAATAISRSAMSSAATRRAPASTRVFGARAPAHWPGWSVLLLATLLELLAYELAYWFGHFLFHRIPGAVGVPQGASFGRGADDASPSCASTRSRSSPS